MIYFFLWIFEGLIVTLASLFLEEFLFEDDEFVIRYLVVMFVFNTLFTWRYFL